MQLAKTSGQDPRLLSRRRILQSAVAGGALLAAAGLAGCATGSESAPSSTQPRKGGVLRVGVTGGGASDTLDAHVGASDPDFARSFQLFEPLAFVDSNNVLALILAESMEPSPAGDYWTVKLRSGVQFHDGKTMTADDVVYSLRRILDPADPKTGAAILNFVDPNALTAVDDLTVRVGLKYPNFTFPEAVAKFWNGIVPVGYDPRNPIGTGPFKYESFTPGQSSVFNRNENYWQSDRPWVDQVVIIDFTDDAARVNALRSGEVDVIDNLPSVHIAPLQQDPRYQVLITETGNWQPFTMRVDAPPFDNVKIRQAMRLAIDRDAMVATAMGGQGRVANDLYSPYDRDFASQIAQRTQDVDQAKSLLKGIDVSDLTFPLVTAPAYTGLVQAAQMLAQQANEVGFRVEVQQVQTGTLFGENYLNWNFSQDYLFTHNYVVQSAQIQMPDSPFNQCHWTDPEFESLINSARRERDDARRSTLLQDAQQIQHDRGGLIIWGFSNQVDAHSSKVAGITPSKSGVPLGNFSLKDIGFVD